MRKSIQRLIVLSLATSLCVATTGCLMIGGKSYTCSGQHKETEAHLAQVEQRIAVLEQYAGITPKQNIDPASSPIMVASSVADAPVPPGYSVK